MTGTLTIHTHEGGTFVLRKKEGAAAPLWELTVKGTVSLNQSSLQSILDWIDKELSQT